MAVELTVERARQGDRDALAELWRAHQHLLLRYFRGRGAAAPEDLASQVWLDVVAGLHRFSGGPDDFRKWLFTIAKRRHVDSIRRSARRAETVDPDPARDRGDPSTAEAFDAQDSLEQALAMIRRLPDDMAEAVLLRVVADLSVAEAAVVMGRTEGSVRVLVHRGLKRLAEKIPVTTSHPLTMNVPT